jgi:type IV secretory pathway VirD2 relaxase
VSDGEGRERDVLRPRIGGRGGEVPQERVPRFRNRLLARVARMGGASGGPSSRPRGTASARDVPRPGPFARRCVIKARYVPMNAYGKRAAALHLSYVERDGVEQDGGAGRVYGPAEASDVRAALSAPLENEKRQFRFIVSPEDGAETDLTAFTRRLMAQVQADLGRVLIWGAVNHWNTENPHVHVIVRGIDEAGRDVTIDGRYLAEGMRSRAQAILTNELGPRTEVDVQRQLAREVRHQRFTSLDRVLQSCEQPGGVLLEPRLPREGRASRVRLTARLGYLQQLGLAVRTSPTAWALREGWADTLRGLGQANDVIKRIHAAVTSLDPARVVIVDESSTLTPIEGVVRSKGLHDELAGRPYAVIESVDGRALYAPLDLATAEKVGEGDIVRLSVQAPPSRGGGVASGPPDQPERRRVILQRIAPPLRQQVGYRGPTWLDSQTARAPSLHGGLGRELGEAVALRDTAVKAMGIPARDSGRRAARLAALEARDLGARLAKDRGLAFVATPVGIAGMVEISPRLASGRRYAVIVDPETRRLWVLPASKQVRALDRQRVEGSLSPGGRLSISRAEPDRRPPSRDR